MMEAEVPPKRRFLQEPHGVTSQKTPFDMGIPSSARNSDARDKKYTQNFKESLSSTGARGGRVMRRYTTSQKVAGSSSDEVIEFFQYT
jgi:hypothetical protein